MDHELGIIEGFYGRPYSQKIRDYLIKRAGSGYSYYVYAPKNDTSLRRRWKEPFSSAEEKNLLHINDSCQTAGLDFGVGLSPLHISNEGNSGLKALRAKVNNIYSLLKPHLICLLFDDIIADCSDLGKRQNEAILTMLDCLPKGTRLIVCPSFYSFDPVLEKIFGAMPENYFKELGENLEDNAEVTFFWTGNKVLSTSFSLEDMQRAQEVTGLRLSVWDNYPVNDGKKICKRINISPFTGREDLSEYASLYHRAHNTAFMHFVNPMCEGALSALALSSLPLIYQRASEDELKSAFSHELELLFGEYKNSILPYLYYLERNDLELLDDTRKQALLALLANTQGSGVKDLKDFILGKYAFDPQCLTS